jgi:hypothetical protein
MASEADGAVEDALNVLVSVTEKSGNLRSDLRKDILRAVSNLRKEFAKLKSEVEDKNKLIIGWEQKAAEADNMLNALQGGAGANGRGDKETTSVGLQVTTKDSDWNVTPSVGRTRMYSDVVADRQGTVSNDHKMYKLFVKSRHNQSAEYSRALLKRKVNPIDMKVGISALKTLKNGQLLIESEKKSELEEVCKKINEVCGEELESYMQKLREPRIIVFNVPEDITTENAVQAIVLQNSELNLNENEIKPKFVFEDKRKHKNLVLEVNSETRKRLVDRKLKIGWHVCNSSDYLSVTRCYKCSKYNHRAQECYGAVVCPHCAQSHTLQECKASKENYRCVNCINYNKYNAKAQINANHSSLDKRCGCYKAALKRYTERLDY